MKKQLLGVLIACQLSACGTIDLVCPTVPSNDCQQWQQSEHINAVKEWNGNGFTYAEALPWIAKEIQAKTARQWLKSGFSRQEAVTYIYLDTDISSAKRWKNSSYTLAEAAKFIKQGILTPKAVSKKSKGRKRAKPKSKD